ncbi:MAG: hypothetical protein SVK54_03300 [candidate division WOR-3 bacterium]|nr:hypothetical protein [candidate division WOR-3 bacterium]
MRKFVIVFVLIALIISCSLLKHNYSTRYSWLLLDYPDCIENEGDYIIVSSDDLEYVILNAHTIGPDPDILWRLDVDNDEFSGTYIKVSKNNAVMAIFNKLYGIKLIEDKNPEIFSELKLNAEILSCEINNDTVFAYTKDNGLYVFNIQSDEFHFLSSMYDTNNFIKMEYQNEYMYALDKSHGLNIVQFSGGSPELISRIDSTEMLIYDFVIESDYIYAATFNPSLSIIDISDKTSPQELELNLGGDFYSKPINRIALGPYENQVSLSGVNTLYCVNLNDMYYPDIFRIHEEGSRIFDICTIDGYTMISGFDKVKILE